MLCTADAKQAKHNRLCFAWLAQQTQSKLCTASFALLAYAVTRLFETVSMHDFTATVPDGVGVGGEASHLCT